MQVTKSKSIKWTQEKKDYVREEYFSGKDAKRIAQELGVSDYAVKGLICRNGWQRRTFEPTTWTKEELEYLDDHYGNIPVYKISRHLKRTVCAVTNKAKRRHLNGWARVDWYNLTDLKRIFRIGHALFYTWVNSGKLKASQNTEFSQWRVKKKDLVDFIRTCPQELNGRVIDMVLFIDLLFEFKYGSHE